MDLGTRIGKDDQEEYHPDLKCLKFFKDNVFQYCGIIRKHKNSQKKPDVSGLNDLPNTKTIEDIYLRLPLLRDSIAGIQTSVSDWLSP